MAIEGSVGSVIHANDNSPILFHISVTSYEPLSLF